MTLDPDNLVIATASIFAFDAEELATVAAIISAFSAMLAAVIMAWHAVIIRDQVARLAEAQEKENKILKVNNKVSLNKMANDFNKIIIHGGDDLISEAGKNAIGVDKKIARRVYLQFCRLNIIESAELLHEAGVMSKEDADDFMDGFSINFANDTEAAELAIRRGYRPELIDVVLKRSARNELLNETDHDLRPEKQAE